MRALTERLAMRWAHRRPLGPLPEAPPGPPGTWLLGHNDEGWNRPVELFLRCMREHGPIVQLRFGATLYFVLNDPELVRRVFVENVQHYEKSRHYKPFRLVVGEGLTTSEGELWRRQRKLMQPAFHREGLASLARTMSVATRECIDRIPAQREALALDQVMNRLALTIVGRTLFSAEVESDALAHALKEANEAGTRTLWWPMWVPTAENRAFQRSIAVFDDIIEGLIAARRRIGEGPRDLFSILMSARDESTGQGMSDRQLRDEALTLILAGHDTTASVLAWTCYLISLHVDVARRLRAHIDEVLGARDPEAEDIPKLGYVAQVIQESMRLYPPGWVLEREPLRDEELAGYRIPRGSIVAVSPYALHRHPAHWSNPEAFDPDRFSPEAVKRRARYAYMPFGAGPRTCIGNHMSMMEMVVIIAMFARAFRMELPPGERVEIEPLTTTIRPRGGLRMHLHPTRDAADLSQ